MPIVPATHGAIRRAAQALARGEIVAFPTETVYGLGANALDARAVAKVFAAKERPRFNPLIVHVPGLAEAEDYGLFNATARRLAEAFWPGPLSLVLQRRSTCDIAELVSAGLDTIDWSGGLMKFPNRAVFLFAILVPASNPAMPSFALRDGGYEFTLRELPIVSWQDVPGPLVVPEPPSLTLFGIGLLFLTPAARLWWCHRHAPRVGPAAPGRP